MQRLGTHRPRMRLLGVLFRTPESYLPGRLQTVVLRRDRQASSGAPPPQGTCSQKSGILGAGLVQGSPEALPVTLKHVRCSREAALLGGLSPEDAWPVFCAFVKSSAHGDQEELTLSRRLLKFPQNAGSTGDRDWNPDPAFLGCK